MHSVHAWCDVIGPRDRAAWHLLIKDGQVLVFQGKNIPGVATIRKADVTTAGKWSHTNYEIDLEIGVHAISGRDGTETGTFLEGLATAVHSIAGRHGIRGKGYEFLSTPFPLGEPLETWNEIAQALGVPVPVAKAFVQKWRAEEARFIR